MCPVLVLEPVWDTKLTPLTMPTAPPGPNEVAVIVREYDTPLSWKVGGTQSSGKGGGSIQAGLILRGTIGARHVFLNWLVYRGHLSVGVGWG